MTSSALSHPAAKGKADVIALGFDMNGTGRIKFGEFDVFTVKDDKIIHEEVIMNLGNGEGHDIFQRSSSSDTIHKKTTAITVVFLCPSYQLICPLHIHSSAVFRAHVPI